MNGIVTPGKQHEWDAADWLDPDVYKQIQWWSLPESERKRSIDLARAMNRATGTNPLAH